MLIVDCPGVSTARSCCLSAFCCCSSCCISGCWHLVAAAATHAPFKSFGNAHNTTFKPKDFHFMVFHGISRLSLQCSEHQRNFERRTCFASVSFAACRCSMAASISGLGGSSEAVGTLCGSRVAYRRQKGLLCSMLLLLWHQASFSCCCAVALLPLVYRFSKLCACMNIIGWPLSKLKRCECVSTCPAVRPALPCCKSWMPAHICRWG